MILSRGTKPVARPEEFFNSIERFCDKSVNPYSLDFRVAELYCTTKSIGDGMSYII